jgi:hypothetical protein
VSELKMRTTTVHFVVRLNRKVSIQVPEELTDDQATAAIEREYKWVQLPQWVDDARDDMYSCGDGDIDWGIGIEVVTPRR